MSTNFDFLKEACQITGADWAALVERESGHWQVRDRRGIEIPGSVRPSPLKRTALSVISRLQTACMN